MIIDIYIYISPCAAPTCVVLLQAAYTFCVSVLNVHIVFDDRHVLNLMCLRACKYVFTPDQANLYIYVYFFFFFNAHYRLVSRFTGVHFNMVCMNVHVLNIL